MFDKRGLFCYNFFHMDKTPSYQSRISIRAKNSIVKMTGGPDLYRTDICESLRDEGPAVQ